MIDADKIVAGDFYHVWYLGSRFVARCVVADIGGTAAKVFPISILFDRTPRLIDVQDVDGARRIPLARTHDSELEAP